MGSSRSSTPSSSGPGKTRQKWTTENDRVLVNAVAQAAAQEKPINWHKIASCLPGRTNKNCRKRWHYKLAHDFRKGLWTPEEDERLRAAVQEHGMKWRKVSQDVKTRNGDQCWKRWNDCLKPEINHSPWSMQEDAILVQQVEELGTAWSEIVSQHLPGRTALAAKNRYVILERRGEPGLGARVSSEDTQAEEGRFDTATSVGPSIPLLGFDTATAGELALLNDFCVPDRDLFKWGWYDTSLSVSNLPVTQNSHWTPDPFSHVLCRNYMTPCLGDELPNEALAPSTVDFPNFFASPGSDILELPGFDLGFDGHCYPMRGPSVGLQDTMSLISSDPSDHLQLDIDMGTFLGRTIAIPQSSNVGLRGCGIVPRQIIHPASMTRFEDGIPHS